MYSICPLHTARQFLPIPRIKSVLLRWLSRPQKNCGNAAGVNFPAILVGPVSRNSSIASATYVTAIGRSPQRSTCAVSFNMGHLLSFYKPRFLALYWLATAKCTILMYYFNIVRNTVLSSFPATCFALPPRHSSKRVRI
jgi:hypothetical protein